MKYIIFDDIDGTILGLSPKEIANYYTLSDDAYDEILKYNGEYKVIVEKVDSSKDCVITLNEISKEWDEDIELAIAKKIIKGKHSCNLYIRGGIQFATDSKCTKNYTYEIEDQINFDQLNMLVDNGILNDDTGVLVKASGEFEYDSLSVSEFKELYNALLKHKFYHLFYLYEYIAYVKTITNLTELNRLQYETALPFEYQMRVDKKMKNFEGIQ